MFLTYFNICFNSLQQICKIFIVRLNHGQHFVSYTPNMIHASIHVLLLLNYYACAYNAREQALIKLPDNYCYFSSVLDHNCQQLSYFPSTTVLLTYSKYLVASTPSGYMLMFTVHCRHIS